MRSERIDADPDSSSQRLVYLLHLASYDFALRYARGRRVLDLGCGTGYGTARLAAHCESIVGVDVSSQAVAAAADRFRAPNLTFRTIDPSERTPLPFEDSTFDVVLSFQVIEHVADPVGYLEEAKRVLGEGGVMILATPDRATRLYRGQKPWNPYHHREYTSAQLESLLRSVFVTVEVQGLGGGPQLLAPELRRTARLRLATLPFTFPGAPERWRRFGLALMTRTRDALTSSRASGQASAPPSERGDTAGGEAGVTALLEATQVLDTQQIQIGPEVHPSVCIVAVAR